MRNVIDQKPTDLSKGNHDRFSYVSESDIRNRRILDIGCGYGWFELLAEQSGAKAVTGLEVSVKDLETAQRNIHSERIEFKVGSALQLPFDDNAFETVVSWEVLEHIPRDSEVDMLKEIRRVLKNDGVLYLSTPFHHPISNLADPAWLLQFGRHRHYKRSQIERFALASGLHLKHSIVQGGLTTLAATLNMYISKWMLHRRPLFHEHVERRVEKDLASSSDKLSSIYCTFQNTIQRS